MEEMEQFQPIEVEGQMKEEPVNIKKERKFCSRMGLSYFIFFLITCVIQVSISLYVATYHMDLMVLHYPIYMLLTMAPIYVVGFPALYLMTRKKETCLPEDHKMSFGNFLIVLLMCFGVMVIGNIIGIIITMLIGVIKGSPLVNPLDSLMGQSSLLVNILIVGICAPVFEELMFRKILMDRFLRYGQATAIFVSGVMFGLFHGNFTQFFYATFLGFLFAYIYAKTGRIHYTIIFHMIINLSSTLIMPVLQKIDMDHINAIMESYQSALISGTGSEEMGLEIAENLGSILVPFIILIIYELIVYGMALAGIILLIVRRKRFVLEKGPIQLPKGKKFSTVWLNLGMIIYFLSCVFLFVSSILQV